MPRMHLAFNQGSMHVHLGLSPGPISNLTGALHLPCHTSKVIRFFFCITCIQNMLLMFLHIKRCMLLILVNRMIYNLYNKEPCCTLYKRWNVVLRRDKNTIFFHFCKSNSYKLRDCKQLYTRLVI